MRAVVIDSSPSVAAAITPDVTAAQVAGAYASRVIEATDLGDGLRRAAAWLRIAPPARREIVVVSDFQNGSLNQQDTEVEDEFGLRFVAVTTGPPPPAPVGDAYADGTRRQVRADLAAGRTGARFEPAIGPEWSGLEIQGASAEEVAFLQRVVARAGTWAPDAALPMVIRFGPLATGGNAVHLSREQVLRMQRLLGSEAIQGLTHRAGVHDDKPLLEVDVDPSSFAAAAAVRAALDSIRDPASMREYDPLRIPPSVLAGWSREAAPVDASVARHADRHDGRWLWGGVLLLLAAETLLRRSHHAVRDEDRARAA